MTSGPLFPEVLINSGKAVLFASSGYCTFLFLRNRITAEELVIRTFLGLVCLSLFSDFLSTAGNLSILLQETIEKLGNKDGLKDLIINSFKEAANGTTLSDGTKSSVLGQVIRTGVWGVLSNITDLVFLLSKLLLVVSKDVAIQFIFLIYPLICGVMPIFPRIFSGFLTQTISILLWMPVFSLISVITSLIARRYATNTSTLGLTILALEIMAIILTFYVPTIASKLVNGAIDTSFSEFSPTKILSILTRFAG